MDHPLGRIFSMQNTILIVGAGFCGTVLAANRRRGCRPIHGTPCNSCALRSAMCRMPAHWDIHRHRLPPQLAARIASLRRSGKLQVNAGRIDSVSAAGEQLRVSRRPRGGGSATAATELKRSRRAARCASRRSPRGAGCALTPAALVRSASASTHRGCYTWRSRCGAARRARRDPTLAPAAPRRNLRPKRKCPGFPARWRPRPQ
jgi:hypothetical protein